MANIKIILVTITPKRSLFLEFFTDLNPFHYIMWYEHSLRPGKNSGCQKELIRDNNLINEHKS